MPRTYNEWLDKDLYGYDQYKESPVTLQDGDWEMIIHGLRDANRQLTKSRRSWLQRLRFNDWTQSIDMVIEENERILKELERQLGWTV